MVWASGPCTHHQVPDMHCVVGTLWCNYLPFPSFPKWRPQALFYHFQTETGNRINTLAERSQAWMTIIVSKVSSDVKLPISPCFKIVDFSSLPDHPAALSSPIPTVKKSNLI